MMVKKLKHLLIKKGLWNLLFRAGLLTAVLLLFALQGKTVWLIPFFLLGLFFYYIEPEEKKEFKISFWFLLILSPLVIYLLNSTPLPESAVFWIKGVVSLIVGATFALILGLIEFYFEKRVLAYTLLNTFILLLIFSAAASFIPPFSLGWPALILFFGLFLLFRETFLFFDLFPGEKIFIPDNKRGFASSLVLAFLGVELLFFAGILPLGVINLAVLLSFFFVLLRDLLVAHFEGRLTHTFLFKQLTFLVFVGVIIFASASWSI